MLLSSCRPPLLEHLALLFVGSTALTKGPRDSDYTAMIAIVHLHFCAKTHPGGEVVSVVIIVFFLAAIARSTQTARSSQHALIGMSRKLAV